MKKINEEILKYLSGIMTKEEIEAFEKKIIENGNLYKELEYIKSKLKDIPSVNDIQINEIYFTNLLPRLKEKLGATKRNIIPWKISYAIPVIILILAVIFFFPSGNQNTKEAYKLLTEEVINNIDDEEVAGKYLDYTLIQNLSYAGINGEIDTSIPSNIEMPSDYFNINSYEYYNEYSSYENYSDEVLEKAYKYLSMLTL